MGEIWARYGRDMGEMYNVELILEGTFFWQVGVRVRVRVSSRANSSGRLRLELG